MPGPKTRIAAFLHAVLLLTLTLLTSTDSLAARGGNEKTPAPYVRATDKRFQALESDKRILRIPYTFTAAVANSGATIALSKSFPPDVLITKVYTYVDTDIVGASNNTIAIGCNTTNDLGTANDFTDDAVNAVVLGAVTTESGAVYTSAGCTPTLRIGAGTTGITAGRAVFFFEFLPVENLLDLQDLKFFP